MSSWSVSHWHHAAILLSVDPSWLNHLLSPSGVSFRQCNDTHFCQRCQTLSVVRISLQMEQRALFGCSLTETRLHPDLFPRLSRCKRVLTGANQFTCASCMCVSELSSVLTCVRPSPRGRFVIEREHYFQWRRCDCVLSLLCASPRLLSSKKMHFFPTSAPCVS